MRGIRTSIVALIAAAFPSLQAMADAPPPPTGVAASDVAFDSGGALRVSWDEPADADVARWRLFRVPTEDEVTEAHEASARAAAEEALDAAFESGDAFEAARVAGQAAYDSVMAGAFELEPSFVTIIDRAEGPTSTLDRLPDGVDQRFVVTAENAAGERSDFSVPSEPVSPQASLFNGRRLPMFLLLAVISAAVIYFILIARSGRPLRIRKIAGLSAVDEAVGRATEMGRPIMYINGIQDMDDLQTVAGINILGRVAKTAAEYDARIEVPTSRSLVMTAARETVQASYFAAGRTDSYNPDLIYYVTDEQFGFVAYVSGMMVREKPAACFYMGAFFAESLILAETGNSIGAIQIAGTAMPSQLPFFVAACDYTLIGEEFFAASAYLSGQPDQLGSLKGQDVGKLIVGIFLVIGCALASLAAFSAEPDGGFFGRAETFLKTNVLSAS